MSEVAFDEASVLAEAQQGAGLSDFGPDGFREGLRMLLRTYDESPFNEKRRRRQRQRLVQLLATRLRVQEAFRKHPEIRERPLPRPGAIWLPVRTHPAHHRLLQVPFGPRSSSDLSSPVPSDSTPGP